MMTEAGTVDPESPAEDQETEGLQPLVELIRERPWVCVLGAAALGFVIARLVRGDR